MALAESFAWQQEPEDVACTSVSAGGGGRLSTLRRWIRRHPGAALWGASILGYALLSIFMSDGLVSGKMHWDERISEYIPWRVEAARLIGSGEFPFFTDRVFAGMPLFSAAYQGALYPPNWLYVIFNPLVACWLELFHRIMGALGMMAYLRSRRLSPAASFLGGVFFLAATYTLIHAGHVSNHEAGLMAPWVVLFARRLLRRPGPGRCAAFVLVYTLHFSIGYQQLTIFATAWIAVDWLTTARWRLRDWRATLWLAGGIVLAAAITAAQTVASVQHAKASVRATMTLDEWWANSYPFSHLLMLFNPLALGGTTTGWIGDQWSTEYWVTLLPAAWVFAAMAVVLVAVVRRFRAGPRTRFVLVYLLGAILILLLAAGKHTPGYAWLFHVPPFNMVRAPAKWLVTFVSMGSVLAAAAIHLSARIGPWRRIGAFAGSWILVSAIGVSAFLFMGREIPPDVPRTLSTVADLVTKTDRMSGLPATSRLVGAGLPRLGGIADARWIHFLFAAAMGLCLFGIRRAPKTAVVAVAIFAAVQWWALAPYGIYGPQSEDVIAKTMGMKPHPLLHDIDPDSVARIYSLSYPDRYAEMFGFPGNCGLFQGFRALQGYCPLESATLCRFIAIGTSGYGWRDERRLANPSPLYELGVSHLIVEEKRLPPEWKVALEANVGTVFQRVRRIDDYTLFALPHTPPRFDLARRWTEVSDFHKVDPLLWESPPPRDLKDVALEKPDWERLPTGGVDFGGEGKIEVLETRGSYQRVRVQSKGKGVLIIRDSYWPGWRSRIVGEEGGRWRRVMRADGVIRAVAVPDGDHIIELKYTPPKWRTGMTITLAGFALWVALVVWEVLRRRGGATHPPAAR